LRLNYVAPFWRENQLVQTKKKSQKGTVVIWKTKMQAKVQLKDSICLKWGQIGSYKFGFQTPSKVGLEHKWDSKFMVFWLGKIDFAKPIIQQQDKNVIVNSIVTWLKYRGHNVSTLKGLMCHNLSQDYNIMTTYKLDNNNWLLQLDHKKERNNFKFFFIWKIPCCLLNLRWRDSLFWFHWHQNGFYVI
jgi:hypothetical protein